MAITRVPSACCKFSRTYIFIDATKQTVLFAFSLPYQLTTYTNWTNYYFFFKPKLSITKIVTIILVLAVDTLQQENYRVSKMSELIHLIKYIQLLYIHIPFVQHCVHFVISIKNHGQ